MKGGGFQIKSLNDRGGDKFGSLPTFTVCAYRHLAIAFPESTILSRF